MKVTFLKAHREFAYFAGDQADIEPEKAQEMIQSGHVILFPGEEELTEEPKKKFIPKK